MPPSVPTEDGPAIIVDSNGVVGVFEGEEKAAAATTASGGVPGLLNDSISSASCTEHEAHAANVSSSSDQQTGAHPGPAANMEVMGIYKRGSVPRESELPEDYVLKDCQQDQVMVRQRLRTRPLFDDDDGDEHHLIDADSDIDDDGDDGSEADDESDGADQTSKGQGGSEQKRKKTKKSKKERLSRRFRRLLRTKADGTEYDVAMFQPEEGLVMKESDWPFFHADLSEHSDSSDDERVSSFGKIVNLAPLLAGTPMQCISIGSPYCLSNVSQLWA